MSIFDLSAKVKVKVKVNAKVEVNVKFIVKVKVKMNRFQQDTRNAYVSEYVLGYSTIQMYYTN